MTEVNIGVSKRCGSSWNK